MPVRKATASAAIDEPDPCRPDPEALRAFLWKHIKARSFVPLVAWLVSFITKLWVIQGDLLQRAEQSSRSKPPSERLSALENELPGLFTPAANDDAPDDPPIEPPKKKPRNKRGPKNRKEHGRTKLPAHLERERVPIPVPDGERHCTRCNVQMRFVRYTEREKLELVPAYFKVILELREVLSCPCCRQTMTRAPRPDEVVDGGVLGNELLVQSMVDHYADGVPFERIARNARAQGVPLSANTLARSVGRMIDLFDPIIAHVFQRCVTSGVVGVDATTARVLDPEHPRGIRTGALWNLLGDNTWSYFGYAPSGHDHHLAGWLEGITLDVVQCDGSATINRAARRAAARAGCHAHARSKLVKALRAGDARALGGIALYAKLFVIEAQSRQAGESAAARRDRRARESVPLMEQLRTWLDARRGDVEPKSLLGRALGYMHRQWERLVLFLRDGRVEMTNNAVERDLRTWVLDRKTWLFCGHDESARRAAAALTVLQTCRHLRIEPRAYLRFVLGKILAGEKDVRVLWPEHFVAPKPETRAPASSAQTVSAAR